MRPTPSGLALANLSEADARLLFQEKTARRGQPDGLLLHGEAACSGGLLRPEGLADMPRAAHGMLTAPAWTDLPLARRAAGP